MAIFCGDTCRQLAQKKPSILSFEQWENFSDGYKL